jgi:heptosyltransferase-1
VSRVYQTTINKVLKSPSLVNPYKLNKKDTSITQIEVSDIVLLAQQLLSKS